MTWTDNDFAAFKGRDEDSRRKQMRKLILLLVALPIGAQQFGPGFIPRSETFADTVVACSDQKPKSKECRDFLKNLTPEKPAHYRVVDLGDNQKEFSTAADVVGFSCTTSPHIMNGFSTGENTTHCYALVRDK